MLGSLDLQPNVLYRYELTSGQGAYKAYSADEARTEFGVVVPVPRARGGWQHTGSSKGSKQNAAQNAAAASRTQSRNHSTCSTGGSSKGSKAAGKAAAPPAAKRKTPTTRSASSYARCEDCSQPRPLFGFESDRKKRWCGECKKSHSGTVNPNYKKQRKK